MMAAIAEQLPWPVFSMRDLHGTPFLAAWGLRAAGVVDQATYDNVCSTRTDEKGCSPMLILSRRASFQTVPSFWCTPWRLFLTGLAPSQESARKIPGSLFATLGRLSGLLVLAVVVAAASTTFGLLGTRFFKTADGAALIRSRACGWPAEVSNLVNLATPEEKDASVLLMVPSRAQYQSSQEYARSCYEDTSDAELAKPCDALVKRRIPSTLSTERVCPFLGDGVCKTDAVRVESGRIDSRETLGINTPDEDKIVVMKNVTCAPIDADQWATAWLDGEPWDYAEGDLIKAYAVGTRPGLEKPESEYPIVLSLNSWSFASEPYTISLVPLLLFILAPPSFTTLPPPICVSWWKNKRHRKQERKLA